MSSQDPQVESSAFLSLPAEIRLQIYSYLLPRGRLDINLCEIDFSRLGRIPTNTSALLSQSLHLEDICRSNGLHLFLVSKRTNQELTSLLSRLTVRFHCPYCYSHWLCNVSYGLGVGIKWMKHVEILYDVECEPRMNGPSLQYMTRPLARFMVLEMLKQCQQTAYGYYGRLDMMSPPRDTWKCEPFLDPSVPWADHPNFRHRPATSTYTTYVLCLLPRWAASASVGTEWWLSSTGDETACVPRFVRHDARFA